MHAALSGVYNCWFPCNKTKLQSDKNLKITLAKLKKSTKKNLKNSLKSIYSKRERVKNVHAAFLFSVFYNCWFQCNKIKLQHDKNKKITEAK